MPSQRRLFTRASTRPRLPTSHGPTRGRHGTISERSRAPQLPLKMRVRQADGRAVSCPVGSRRDLAAVAKLLEPLFHLLVVVRESAVCVWQVDAVETFERPPGHLVSDQVLGWSCVPLSGPAVCFVTGARAGQ